MDILKFNVEVLLKKKYGDDIIFISSPKYFGRNEGYILQFVARGNLKYNYFVKLQKLDLKEMLVYKILQNIGIGADDIFFSIVKNKDGIYNLGIASLDVLHDKPTSSFICGIKEPKHEIDILVKLVAALFNMNDIPSNIENWGLIDDSILKIVDFGISFVYGLTFPILNFNRIEPKIIPKLNKHFPFLFKSHEEFDNILRQVMGDVCHFINSNDDYRNSLSIVESFNYLNDLNNFVRLISCNFAVIKNQLQ